MKKGRAGFRVEVVAPEQLSEAVTAALFRHSTTAGVRRWVAERATLARRQVTVELAPQVSVRVKVLEQPGADGVRVKPEYEDVLAAARALGRPPLEVARAVQRAGAGPAAVQGPGPRGRGRGGHRAVSTPGMGAGIQRRRAGVAGGTDRFGDREFPAREPDLQGRADGVRLYREPVRRPGGARFRK